MATLRGTPVTTSGSTATIVLAAPTGVVSGDFQLCVVANGTGTATVNTPAGWTLAFGPGDMTAYGNSGTYYVFTSTTATGSVTFTKSGTTNRGHVALRIAYQGSTTTGVVSGTMSNQTIDGDAAARSAPAQSVTAVGQTVVAWAFRDDAAGGTSVTATANAGWNERVDFGLSATNDKINLYLYDNTPASTGSYTCTITSTAAATTWGVGSLVLAPAVVNTDANAECPTGSGAANNATVRVSGPAQSPAGTGTANNATTSSVVLTNAPAQAAAGTGVANAPSMLRAYAEAASGTGAADAPTVQSSAPPFTDDFSTNTVGTLWSTYGTASITGGQASTLATTGYSGFFTSTTYDWRGRNYHLEIVNHPTSAGTLEAYASLNNGSSGIQFSAYGTTLAFVRNNNGTYTDVTTTTYNRTNHRWWRIRTDATGTTFYGDTSPDGLTWTNFSSVAVSAVGINPAALTAEFGAGRTGGTNDTVLFDNVNVTPVPPNADVPAASVDGSGAANSASPAIRGNAQAVSGSGAANSATVSAGAAAQVATGSGVANGATVTVRGNAQAPTGSGLANNPTVSTLVVANANAEIATGTGVASNATIAISVSDNAPAEVATGVGLANNPTISTSGAVLAQVATGSGAAYDVTARVADQPLAATATGAANTPTVVTGTVTQRWLGIDTVAVKTSVTGGQARIAWSTSSSMTSPTYSASLVTVPSDGVTKHAIPASLTPDTTYYYAVEYNGALIGGAQQTRTLPTSGGFSFGFSSCRDHTGDSAILSNVLTRGCDFFLEIGDFHYRDITSNSESLFLAGYDEFYTRTNITNLLKQVPTDYTWSDHDFCGDNSDGTSAARPAAQSAYRKRVPHTTLPATGGGIYHTFTVGRVRFIVLDTRSYRSPSGNTDNSSKTMLGTEQKSWLQNLLANADTPLTFIISAEGWVATSADSDHWGAYQTERSTIAGWITAADTEVVFLCGDAHMLAIDNGSNSAGGAHVWHAAALNRSGSTKGGPYSGGTLAGTNQYGYVTVSDNGTVITATYSGIKSDTTVWNTDSVSVNEPTTNAPAGAPNGTGSANQPFTSVKPATEAAAGTGAANNPSVSISDAIIPVTATATAVANDATISVSDTGASGVATATGTANNAVAKVGPAAATATASAVGNGAVGGVGAASLLATGSGTALAPSISADDVANAQVATGSGAAYDATTTSSGATSPATATATVAANNASVATTAARNALADVATATATALGARGSVAVRAAASTSTGVANNGAASVGRTAQTGAGTGVGVNPTTRVRVNALPATGTGVAPDATVVTAAHVNASAQVATGTASALGATGGVGAQPASPAGVGAVENITSSTEALRNAPAQAALGSGAAYGGASVRVNAQTATGVGSAPGAGAMVGAGGSANGNGSASNLGLSSTVRAGVATGAGVANTAGHDTEANIQAGFAEGSGAAFDGETRVGARPAAITVVGTVSRPTFTVVFTSEAAEGSGAARKVVAGWTPMQPTGLGSAYNPSVSLAWGARPATGVGTVPDTLAQVPALRGQVTASSVPRVGPTVSKVARTRPQVLGAVEEDAHVTGYFRPTATVGAASEV